MEWADSCVNFRCFFFPLYMHRLSLNATVDLKKLRFFTIPHDSGSVWTKPVSNELMEIQRKVCQIFKKGKKDRLQTFQIELIRRCSSGGGTSGGRPWGACAGSVFPWAQPQLQDLGHIHEPAWWWGQCRSEHKPDPPELIFKQRRIKSVMFYSNIKQTSCSTCWTIRRSRV